MNEILPIQMVCEMAKNIPASPWLLPHLDTLLKNPDATVEEIEALIRKDPGLSSAILRMANSAYFAASAKCDTLHDALLRLGNREVFRLSSVTIAGRWLANEVPGYGWEPGDLCRHSLCVAVAAEILAKETKHVKPETAYLGGLLHDVGKLALAYSCSSGFEQVRLRQLQTKSNWREAEKEIFGYDHTDVGGVLLEGWAYPISLVEVATYYPRPALAGSEHRCLVTHVHAAKHIALEIGVGVGEEGYSTELDEATLHEEGLTPELMELSVPKVILTMEKLMKALSPNPAGRIQFE